MIIGIGADIVQVRRFEQMQHLPHERLLRLFTEYELYYAAQTRGGFSLERLASRFAAKEAFFKAFSNYNKGDNRLSFLTIAPLVEVRNNSEGAPSLIVDWTILKKKLQQQLPVIKVHVSLAHEKEYAQAFVILEV